MGNDVLRSLLCITLNGPDLDTPDLAELIGKTVQRYESATRCYKKPPKPSTKSHSIQIVPVSIQTLPIPLETDEMTTLETLTKLSKDYLVSNLDGDSSTSESSIDDEDEYSDINPDFQMKNSFRSGQETLGFDYVLSTLLKSWFNLRNVI